MGIGWVFGLIAAIAVAFVVAAFLSGLQGSGTPAGLAKANGRIEVERLDIAAKYNEQTIYGIEVAPIQQENPTRQFNVKRR